MAIPFATKNELKALDDKITAAEQTPVASVRNTAPIYKHTIVMSGTGESITSNLTVVLYSTTNETLTAGAVNMQEVINKVFNNIISYESFDCTEAFECKIPRGFVISPRVAPEGQEIGIAFSCVIGYDIIPDLYTISEIISDTVGD